MFLQFEWSLGSSGRTPRRLSCFLPLTPWPRQPPPRGTHPAQARSPGDKISWQVWGPKVERVHDREISLSGSHWPRSRGHRIAPRSSGLAAVLAPMGGTRAEPRIDRLALGLASLTSPRYTGPTGRLWSHIFRPFPLTPSSTSLHSSRQSQNALFQAKS